MSRHPRSTNSFPLLELASFFAQLRAIIGVSLDRPSFYFFSGLALILLFLFCIRVSLPVSSAACRVRPRFLPSSPALSVRPKCDIL
jgi:hypothetical protein